jgi:hypothetical protein
MAETCKHCRRSFRDKDELIKHLYKEIQDLEAEFEDVEGE